MELLQINYNELSFAESQLLGLEGLPDTLVTESELLYAAINRQIRHPRLLPQAPFPQPPVIDRNQLGDIMMNLNDREFNHIRVTVDLS